MDGILGERYKSLYSLQSIRVKLRAQPGGGEKRGRRETGKQRRGRTRVGGGILAKMESGPIKVKAKGNMNDLNTHRKTYMVDVKHTCIEYSSV